MVKFIISSRFFRHTPFWWWVRLIDHQGFRFDDYYVWREFWSSLNAEWEHMEYVHKFEDYWGKGVKPEKIVLPKEDFDALVDRLNQPPDPDTIEKITKVLQRKAPWEND